jgi:hypothetical protein
MTNEKTGSSVISDYLSFFVTSDITAISLFPVVDESPAPASIPVISDYLSFFVTSDITAISLFPVVDESPVPALPGPPIYHHQKKCFLHPLHHQ